MTHPRSISYAAKIADLFLRRFDPEQQGLDETEFQKYLHEIREEINSNVQEAFFAELLLKMTEIVEKTYKTNVYLKNRYALSLRLDPSIMGVGSKEESTLPYGVVFVSDHIYRSVNEWYKYCLNDRNFLTNLSLFALFLAHLPAH